MKAGILITARLKSERLPKKVLKPLLGRPMLSYLIDRLRLSQHGEEIVLCTSTVSQDDPLQVFAETENIKCFRGHPEDVLARNLGAAEKYGYDLILSCTADNPFIDTVWMDKLSDAMQAGQYDFGTMVGLPFGSHSYSFTQTAVRKACDVKDELDTEVWGGYFTQTGLFNCLSLQVDDQAFVAPDLRLTVDEEADFQLVSSIFKQLGAKAVPALPAVISFLRNNPGLALMNEHIVQKSGKPIRLKGYVND